MNIYHLWYWIISTMIIFEKGASKPKAFVDKSVHEYINERLCWSTEPCKEEFRAMFNCRCPGWSHCRSPGKYYNAYCSIVENGYIWTQTGQHNVTNP